MTHRTTSWNAPYTFSGKEKDVETGYGYFGARYYDSDLSIWLSVDPMAENTPFASPYAYCINNPIILHDPDGQDWFVNENTGQVFFNSEMGKNAAGTGNMKGDGWTWMGANDMFGEVNDEFFANNSEFNTGNNCFQAWETKGLDGERTNGYEMDFAGKSSAFMSKMGYNKVLKSAIAKVTTTVSSIPDVEGPNPKSSKNVELSDCKYTYAKKGSIQSYNAKQLTASRVSTSLELQTSTSVYKEFRQFSYSIPKPKLNIKADSFNVLKGYKRGYVY
jgi:RHS repeat-associated protein